MGYDYRGPPRRGQGRKSQKRREMAAEYSESGHTIGHLETWLRLWLCENCFEIIFSLDMWRDQLIALVFFIFPLVLAARFTTFYSEFICLTLVTNIWRRMKTVHTLEAVLDLTVLMALVHERWRRIDKKRIGNFEREIIALATPTIRLQMLVSICAHLPKPIAFLSLIAYGRAVQDTFSQGPDWRISAPSPMHTRLAIFFDDTARFATVLTLTATLFLLRSKDAGMIQFVFLASSHLFFIAPAAFTEALDDWVFLDFVFLLLPVLTLACIIRKAFSGNNSCSTEGMLTATYFVRLFYTAILLPFFIQALHLDRKPQFELNDKANFDKRVSLIVRRMLNFEFALDQVRHFAQRPWHWPLVLAATLLAFSKQA